MATEDSIAKIQAILLAKERSRIKILEDSLESLGEQTLTNKKDLLTQVKNLQQQVQWELEKEQQQIQGHHKRIRELQAALDALASIVPDSPEAIIEQIKPVMGDLVGEAIQEQPEVMAESLGPVMGEAIRVQIRDAREEMVETLYPIIGTTIGRAISDAIQELQRNIDARMRNDDVTRCRCLRDAVNCNQMRAADPASPRSKKYVASRFNARKPAGVVKNRRPTSCNGRTFPVRRCSLRRDWASAEYVARYTRNTSSGTRSSKDTAALRKLT